VGIQKSEAILLSKRDIRETSSLVVFYTEDFGKIKGLVKGARGAQAKFGLYLSEFSKFDIVYYEKQKTDTYLVTQADLKDSYTEIAEDLDKRLLAYYILELVDKFTPLEETSKEIYSLLTWILEFIRRQKFTDRAIVIFQLKLLQYAGFLPQMENCAICSGKLSKDTYFSIRNSGLLCSSCKGGDIQAIPFSKGAVASVNMIRKAGLRQLERQRFTRDITKELKRLLDRFIDYHLGEHLKAGEFIKEATVAGVI
jgi:DNA repair protein RecO (recombination protein O)